MPMFGFTFITELGVMPCTLIIWANNKEKGRIVHFNWGFKNFDVQMDFIGVVALFAFHS